MRKEISVINVINDTNVTNVINVTIVTNVISVTNVINDINVTNVIKKIPNANRPPYMQHAAHATPQIHPITPLIHQPS